MEKTGMKKMAEKDVMEKSMDKMTEQEMIRLVQEKMPDIHIDPIEVEKNNGRLKKAYQVYGEDDFKRMVVYQESVIKACGPSCSAREAADYLCQVIEEEKPVLLHQEAICDWEKIKSGVYRKIVNYEKNADRLPFYVHRRFLDLAELCYVRVEVNEKGWGSAEVTLKLLETWGIEPEELERQAERNLEAEGYEILPVEEILPGMSCCSGLYLIQNQRRELGAAVMTRPGRMKALLEKLGSSVYVFPSSIHELLVLPDDGNQDVKDLRELVREVNRTAVTPEEFLSDQVYYCHLETGEIELCQEEE